MALSVSSGLSLDCCQALWALQSDILWGLLGGLQTQAVYVLCIHACVITLMAFHLLICTITLYAINVKDFTFCQRSLGDPKEALIC